MKKTILALSLIAITALSVTGQTAAELKQRMNDRLPAILEMKTAQLVGENNEAYLTILKEVSESQATTVQQENADRRAVYTMLSKQTGATLDLVQKKRAEQLRELATSGTMIQTAEGAWQAKP